jgi:hypothetical protein
MTAARRLFHHCIFAAVGIALAAAIAPPAQARVFFGFGFPLYGPPMYYPPPPVYYPPPPVYYVPPPAPGYAPPPAAGYAPPAYSPAPAADGRQSCYAGPYVCPMEHAVASGSGCYCRGNDGQRVWGRAS